MAQRDINPDETRRAGMVGMPSSLPGSVESSDTMADLTRAEDLVQTIERDDAFRAEVESAPTVSAKREVLDRHGFRDVGLDDMKVYIESKGGHLVFKDSRRELSDDELAAVAGGGYYTNEEIGMFAGATAIGIALGAPIAAAAAA